MPEKDIILIGGGGHCRSCIDVIETGGSFKIAGIVEQLGKNKSEPILGYPVLGDDTDLETLKKQYDYALITIGQVGSSGLRENIFYHLKKLGFVLPCIISPLAHVSRHARVGEGTIIMHKVIVNAQARVGSNCILNTSSLVEHDTEIGDHTHISTAAVINGGAIIGSGSFVGSNATIVQNTRLPDHYFFKAKSLVKSLKDGRMVKETRL